MNAAIPLMGNDDPQWSYLLTAISRIEARLQSLADSDAQKSADILSIKADLHRVERQLEEKISAYKIAYDEKIRPMTDIADKIHAGKVVMAAIFGALLAISGMMGAWSVIKEYFLK